MEAQDLYKEIYLKVDFALENQVVQKEIPRLVQYDNNSGLLIFDLYNDGRRINMSDVSIVVNFKLPSGEGVHDNVTLLRPSSSRAMYFTPLGILSEVGIVEGDITLIRGDVQATSCVKFKLEVIKGIETETIVDNEKYPILQKLINKVEDVDSDVQEVINEMNDKLTELDSFVDDLGNSFNDQKGEMQTEFNTMISQQDQDFNEQLEIIEKCFDDKYNEIDEAFNNADIDQMFANKYEGLEEEYAQTYSDVKDALSDIYSTTLKYRIIE